MHPRQDRENAKNTKKPKTHTHTQKQNENKGKHKNQRHAWGEAFWSTIHSSQLASVINRASCVTNTMPPLKALMASHKASTDSMSKWFVGSSKKMMWGCQESLTRKSKTKRNKAQQQQQQQQQQRRTNTVRINKKTQTKQNPSHHRLLVLSRLLHASWQAPRKCDCTGQ